jgi:hypothetical protein
MHDISDPAIYQLKLVLQIRTRVLNDDLRDIFRQRYPSFPQGMRSKVGNVAPPGFSALRIIGLQWGSVLREAVQFLPKSQLDNFSRYHSYITVFLVVSKPVVNSSYMLVPS